MSMQINNGVVNIKETPGIIADVTANFPVVDKIAEGTIYIDTQTLLIWRAQSGGWVQLGGGVGTPTLDQVLTAGNTAINENIILTSSVPGSNITYTSSDVYSCLDSNNTVLMGMRWANIYAENLNTTNIVEINFQTDSILKSKYNNTETGLYLDFANDVYKFGDWNAISNGNYIEVDNFNNSFYCFTQILELNAQWSGIRGAVGVTKIGDLAFNNNGTFCGVDDVNETLIFSTNLKSATAGGSAGQHLKININGTDYKIALLNP